MAATPVVVNYVDLYDVLALGDREVIVLEGGTPVVKSIDDFAAGTDLTTEQAARAAGDTNAIGTAAGLALVLGG